MLTIAADDPGADLKVALEKLSKAQTFSIKAKRTLDAALQEGAAIPASADLSIVVKRPNSAHITIKGEGVERQLFFNGTELAVVDKVAGAYVKIPAKGDLDGLVALFEEKLGFTPPLADLLVSDPHPLLVTADTKVTDGGEKDLDGIKCHLITGKDDLIEWFAYLDSATGLPKKIKVVATTMENTPALTIEFSEINLEASADDSTFVYTPTEGAVSAKIVKITEIEVGKTE